MEQNIAITDTGRAQLAGEAATRPTVQNVLEVANDLRIRLEDILESLDQMQASLNRYDELRM